VVTNVAHAAEVLGISQGAVRKRIERGQLNGRKIDGQWRVFLDATNTTETTRQDTTHATPPPEPSRDQAQTHHDTSRAPVVSATAQAQLDAFRDAILRPHLERIEELAKDVGRLTAERDQVRSQLDAAISDRDQATQRLASDRALIDMMAVEMTVPPAIKTNPQSVPKQIQTPAPSTEPKNQRSLLLYLGEMAAIVTVFAYVGLTMSELQNGAILSANRIKDAITAGVVISCAIGLLMGQLYRFFFGPPPTFRSILTDPFGRCDQSRQVSSNRPAESSDN
jgi:hypothetical protein